MSAHTPHAHPLTDHWLGALDIWLLAEGKHQRPWEKLGAHPTTLNGQAGTAFAVWAPHARSVGLAGDFNAWVSQPMTRQAQCGVWVLFVPGVGAGAWYKFDV